MRLASVDGEGTPPSCRVQEIDGDGTRTGADIPKNSAGERCQLCQRAGTCVTLRHLAVSLESGIRRGNRRRRRNLIRAGDADNMKIRNGAFRPVSRRPVDPRLGRAAKIGKNMQRCRAIALMTQDIGKPCRR